VPSAAELLTRAFYAWELRGRGWQVYDRAVTLEPPFRPFAGHVLAPRPALDDGRRETTLSALAGRFFGRAEAPPRPSEPEDEPAFEPEPDVFRAPFPLSEIAISLPQGAAVSAVATEHLLISLAACRFPLAFEVVGRPESVGVGVACRLPDRERVMGLVKAHFPEAILGEATETLRATWQTGRGGTAAVEFGLAREFMLPLRTFRDFRPDPLLSLYAALAGVGEGEIGAFQVLFTPAAAPWAESVIRAVHTPQGEPFFEDDPELTKLARDKVTHPFFAVAVRMGAKATDLARAWDLVRGMTGALYLLDGANELTPLAGDIDLEADLLSRTTHRSGMLLTTPELAALVHLPGDGVRLAKLAREIRRTKPAPPEVRGEGVLLGENVHEGRVTPVRLPPDLRARHTHVVGASGTGKSTALIQIILEDVRGGGGVAVLDPHGDLVDEILTRFPEERERDLILFDPSDQTFRAGWNMLAARTEIEKVLLSSDLVAAFRRLSTSWGDQMTSVLGNAIQAFLESTMGGTLLDLRRFLVDRDFRAEFLRTVEDPEVRYYFEREFPLLRGMPQGSILTRLDTFLRPKLVRAVVAEREHRLDFREMVDGGTVFLAKLAQGAIGEENAALLGSLLVSAFHQAALSRQDLAPEARRPFALYVDECHHMATPSMAALLSGARKYRLSLTAAHQELGQLRAKAPEVLSALLANAATRIVFRVSEEDARQLERGFSYFTAADLVNLGVGEAVSRVGRSEDDFNLTTPKLPAVDPEEASARRERLLALMRERFPVPPTGREEAAREEKPTPPPPIGETLPERPRRAVALKEPQSAPPALGRGGPEHQYLQELVKRLGEARGFRVVIEKPILDGKGSVDVALEREGFTLACEISVTTGVEQEVQNALKCLKAGFDRVALVSLKRNHLTRLRTALHQELREEDRSRLLFLTPEEVLLVLDTAPFASPKEEMVGGYRVKVEYEVPDENAKASRARAIADLIAKRVNPKKRGGP
jgi:hypothetical protein